MNMSNWFIIIPITVGIFIIILSIITGLSTIMYPISAAGFAIAVIRYYFDKNKEKKKRCDIIEQFIKPAISPIITVIKTNKLGNFSPAQIEDIENSVESGVRDKDDIIPTIVNVASKFTDLLIIDPKYKKSYSLALSYKLVFTRDTNEGQAAREINSKVTKGNKIRCGTDYWPLSREDVEWFLKFSEFEELLLPFEQIYNSIKDLDVVQVQKDRDETYSQIGTFQKYFKENDLRFKRLLALILEKIPTADFFKIISNLQSDIIVISLHGMRDPSDVKGKPAPTGHQYINRVLQEQNLDYGKLNRSVYFAFLSDVMSPNTDPRFFDLQAWGKQIEIRANELRKQDNGQRRRFSFIVLKSSLHELRSFGDKIGDTSRVKISPAMLTHLDTRHANPSILVIISKILRETQSLSLHDFINKNLEYVNGIDNKETAKIISEGLGKQYNKEEWLIEDFKRRDIKKEDLVLLGFSEEQAYKIINEAVSIAEIFIPV
ncbi:exported protein of unknown function [Nitrosotalea devaniterrae]|uniref:Uncharacterized protein n=1 Tax=Nitrosotalea devaniterrae TaxID=1078905 RepID=A0A128A1X9_9ARCH|nr:exported protein of unknown function [Candidatus Nitrosotalea devanaterra]